ncbi:MAG: 3'-5' exonuclease, partial [Verrucomicrobia bacterium 21-51-4]
MHIADVNAYVKQGTALDKEAQARGNSTYLVGTVIPMLPHVLSNGLCSLVEAQDRLTKTVFLTFDAQLKLVNTEFANSVICSRKRLSYPQAFAFLKEDNLKTLRTLPSPPAHQTGATGRPLSELNDPELLEIQKTLRLFWRIAHKLRSERMEAGSLDLDMPEVKIYVDKDGYADRIERVANDISHQLIEEFMLAANEAIAKALYTAQMPLISRVHDKPDDNRLNEYRDYLSTFRIHTGDLTVRKSVVKLLEQLKTHPQAHHLRIEFLKSLKQACYRARADGHYGLHKAHYTHFTSPIRRYSDLVVHRLFDSLLIKQGLDTAPT